MKILVTGSTGLLGGSLLGQLQADGLSTIGHGNSHPADVKADLSDRSETNAMLSEVGPDVIVNLVCLSNVDACEKDPNQAYLLNVRTLENIAAWLGDHPKTRLVHISTDQVYDGPGEHTEDQVTLRNYYAFSKYASEFVALQVNGLVLRTNFFGASHTKGKKSFSDWLVSSFRAKSPITLFTDVLFSPLSMRTLCEMIIRVLPCDVGGVFNLGSRQGMSKCDFAHALAAYLQLPTDAARDGVVADVSLAAPRPSGMLMDSGRFERTFNVQLPTLKEEITNVEI